jgi:hypothetical protein
MFTHATDQSSTCLTTAVGDCTINGRRRVDIKRRAALGIATRCAARVEVGDGRREADDRIAIAGIVECSDVIWTCYRWRLSYDVDVIERFATNTTTLPVIVNVHVTSAPPTTVKSVRVPSVSNEPAPMHVAVAVYSVSRENI